MLLNELERITRISLEERPKKYDRLVSIWVYVVQFDKDTAELGEIF